MTVCIKGNWIPSLVTRRLLMPLPVSTQVTIANIKTMLDEKISTEVITGTGEDYEAALQDAIRKIPDDE